MNDVLHSKPWITAADTAAVIQTLKTGMLAQGRCTARFEEEISRWGGGAGGVAVGSGSAAIVLALTALEVGGGDEVILPSYVCPKVLEAVLTVGATPALCDIGEYWMVGPEHVAPCVTARTRALILPHLYGIFADARSFRQFGVPVIEDCAQAIGPARDWPLGPRDISIYSFHPTKLVTTGEGGMAVCASTELLRRMRALRDGDGANYAARLFSPLPDSSASLGLSQFARYNEMLKRRRDIARAYIDALEAVLPGGFASYPMDRTMFFRFPIKLPGGIGRFKPLFAERGIRVSNGVDLLLHRRVGLPDERFPMSVALFEQTVSLPIYPALTPDEQRRCIEAAVELIAACARGAQTAL